MLEIRNNRLTIDLFLSAEIAAEDVCFTLGALSNFLEKVGFLKKLLFEANLFAFIQV